MPICARCATHTTTFSITTTQRRLLTVNAEHLNPLDSDADLALLVDRIETMRGRKEFFVKGTSL